MKKEIKLHEKMLQVICDNDDVYYIEASKEEMFLNDLETKKFVRLNGELVRVFDIKRVKPYDSLGFENLPKNERQQVQGMIRRYQDNLGEYPSKKAIAVMISKVLQEN